MEPWIAVYERGVLVCRVPGKACLNCPAIVFGTELDADGRCPECGPAEAPCEDCDCAWPAEDLCSREMRLLCPGCVEDRELELTGSGVWTSFDDFRSGGV